MSSVQNDAILAAAEARPLWWAAGETGSTRPALEETRAADVVIVGAGFTGLWTAYYLTEIDPSLDIVVLESRHVGFGASGRNGGWCYDGFAADLGRIEAASDTDTARRFGAALRDTVGEVGRVAKAEGIEADFHLGGAVEFCRNGGQLARARRQVESARWFGWDPADVRMMERGEALQVARVSNVQGALWASHAASVHPGRLVHGLASAVERRGVAVHEGTRAVAVEAGSVRTAAGASITAPAVLRCTEGYTSELSRRYLAPFSSTMIATEPIRAELWDQIGLADRQLFGDLRHMVVYGQRTSDDRIAFGGRGAPYRFGSNVARDDEAQLDAQIAVHRSLLDLLPQLRDVGISHRWSGILGVPRDWFPHVRWDGAFGSAGGYVGAGVAASNLAGRTLAQLVLGRTSELGTFPWVNRRVRRWEPEPFRFLGLNAALRVMRSADRFEERTGSPARRADAMWRLIEY